jgi:hypothetical protein
MKFLDILGFKNTHKKIRQTRLLESIHELHFVEGENYVRKLKSEKTRVYAQKA